MTRTHNEIVTDAAEVARSTANRLAMAGLEARLLIYATRGTLIVDTWHSGADVAGLHYCGEIRADVPYSHYWQRIADMSRSAPLF